MSIHTPRRSLIIRSLTRPTGLMVLAMTVIFLFAGSAQAVEPVVRQVLGVDQDARINGKININARIGGTSDRVIFNLTGPISRTTSRKTSPYFFLSNKAGNPRYWNTANAPQGAYTMRVKAIKDGRVVDSMAVKFTIDHKAVKQDALPRKQRARTVNSGQTGTDTTTGDTGSGGTSNNANQSSQPVVTFAADTPDTYERGSGETVAVKISGTMTDQSDVLVLAWDDTRKQMVDRFAHVLNSGNPMITADKLELLPDGHIQLQLLYRERSVVQYKKMRWVDVVTPAGSTDLGGGSVTTVNPPKITAVTGLGAGTTLTGVVQISASVEGDTPDEVIFSLTGASEAIYIDANPPYAFISDNGTWDTSKHPNGAYQMTITSLVNGEQTDARTINFTIDNAVTVPDPVVSFPSDSPDTYRLGSGRAIPFELDRDLPDNGTVLVLAWSAATWAMVDEFAHYNSAGPWRIEAQKLELLPPGRAQLQLLYRVDDKTVYKRTHDLEILPAYGAEPVTEPTPADPIVDNGDATTPGDTGSNGTVADDTTTTADGGTTSGGGSSSVSTTNESTADGTTPGDIPAQAGDILVEGQQPVLGMNLSFVTYWTREWVFTNVLRQAKGWMSTNTGGQPWDNGGQVATDANGWPILEPGQAAATLVYNATDGHYPGGRYICTYDGEGDILFDFDAKVASRSPGRIEVDVTPSNSGIYMRIENTTAGNHVRNVKLVLESLVDHPSSFHPLFVERLKPFKTLRFMDWQRTNTTRQVRWSDRNLPSNFTHADREGVAIELLIELANELKADAWVCMPAQADDDYVRRFAQLVKDRLHPGGKVYVEWSNEVWNTQFEVHKWIKSETDGRSLSSAFFDRWAAEARRDFAIWSQVFAGDDRLVRVAASQAALVYATEQLTKRLNGQFDSISCSTYFALSSREERAMTSSTSPDEIVAILAENIVTDNRRYYSKHGELARRLSTDMGRAITLIAYEGGQHLADGGQNKPHKNALIGAQNHPKMYDLYLQNMFEFEKAGGSANVMFNYVGRRDQWGSWGHLLYQDQPTNSSVKFKAMLDYPGSQKRLELTTFD